MGSRLLQWASLTSTTARYFRVMANITEPERATDGQNHASNGLVAGDHHALSCHANLAPTESPSRRRPARLLPSLARRAEVTDAQYRRRDGQHNFRRRFKQQVPEAIPMIWNCRREKAVLFKSRGIAGDCRHHNYRTEAQGRSVRRKHPVRKTHRREATAPARKKKLSPGQAASDGAPFGAAHG